MNSLPITIGRGVKTRLKGLEMVVSEQLEIHSRNLKNVLLHLEEKHSIRICKKTLQNFLKDTGYRWKRARMPLKRLRKQDEFQLKQGQIESLKQLEDSGFMIFTLAMKVILDLPQMYLMPGKRKRIRYCYLPPKGDFYMLWV